MVNSRISMVARVVMLLAVTLLFVPLPGDSVRDEETIQPLVGDPDVVQAAYERWKKAYASRGGDATLRLELGHSRGLSAEVSAARGHAVLDLRSGALAVEVRDLPAGEFDVWLIGNRSGQSRSVKPRSGDAMVRVGRLTPGDRAATLAAELPRSLAGAFTLDLIAVSHAAGDPTTRGVLFGAPNLFQRLYYQERQGRPASAAVAAPFGLLVPRPAFAANGSPVPLAQLVAQGERIFFEQTFEGNGRTCGTCHPATNNFTIDRAFIETLPLDDPLFVAEFTPALLTDFEKPELMRASGLILENVDGFEDLPNKFTMRGVPHTLGMAVSLTAFPPGQAPLEATGWSGDGAPGSGTLREFAIGAVIQHFTKSLNRVEGVDFRLPTDHELDALEAFQRSLGRQEELDLAAMTFTGIMEDGRLLFLDPTGGKCDVCHKNAGANIDLGPAAGLVNFNFDTGVEQFAHPSDEEGADGPVRVLPCDDGFGRTPAGNGCFGDGRFNTPSLVEAADTPPFFHNNAVGTIEEAVAFYVSDAFNDSESGEILRDLGGGLERAIVLSGAEILAVAAFLRGINALENIRSSIAFGQRAQRQAGLAPARALLQLSLADIRDAIKVLQDASLHPEAVSSCSSPRT